MLLQSQSIKIYYSIRFYEERKNVSQLYRQQVVEYDYSYESFLVYSGRNTSLNPFTQIMRLIGISNSITNDEDYLTLDDKFRRGLVVSYYIF